MYETFSDTEKLKYNREDNISPMTNLHFTRTKPPNICMTLIVDVCSCQVQFYSNQQKISNTDQKLFIITWRKPIVYTN